MAGISNPASKRSFTFRDALQGFMLDYGDRPLGLLGPSHEGWQRSVLSVCRRNDQCDVSAIGRKSSRSKHR
jgi:hypothetical protein